MAEVMNFGPGHKQEKVFFLALCICLHLNRHLTKLKRSGSQKPNIRPVIKTTSFWRPITEPQSLSFCLVSVF